MVLWIQAAWFSIKYAGELGRRWVVGEEREKRGSEVSRRFAPGVFVGNPCPRVRAIGAERGPGARLGVDEPGCSCLCQILAPNPAGSGSRGCCKLIS